MVLDELHLAEQRWRRRLEINSQLAAGTLDVLHRATANSPVLRLTAVVSPSDIDLAFQPCRVYTRRAYLIERDAQRAPAWPAVGASRSTSAPQSTPVAAAQPHASGPSPTERWASWIIGLSSSASVRRVARPIRSNRTCTLST